MNVQFQHFCQKMWALKKWCITKVAHCIGQELLNFINKFKDNSLLSFKKDLLKVDLGISECLTQGLISSTKLPCSQNNDHIS